MISVLIADDSFLMRKLIADILTTDPDIRVVGSVADGEEVVREVKRLHPDVITMDLEMPKMSGLEATKKILTEAGVHPIVLMVSAFSDKQADSMLECLRAGAFDCVLKPSGTVSLDLDTIKNQLIAKVKAAASARREALGNQAQESKKEIPVPPVRMKNDSSLFPVILIGASTGGPPILEEIFSHLPPTLQAAVLVVQHMPEKFTTAMAERFDRLSGMKVKEAADGEVIKPGVALIAPGNFHMRVASRHDDGLSNFVVKLSQDEPVHGMRPSIDVLMESAAQTLPNPLVGIILTGMGQDGAEGIAKIHARGGMTVVQNPESCVVDSMVQAAMKHTEIDATLMPSTIADFMMSLTHA